MARKIKEGDKVLFYGKELNVIGFKNKTMQDGTKLRLVRIGDEKVEREGEKVRKHVLALRQQQLSGDTEKVKHSVLAREIEDKVKNLTQLSVRFNVREDLLSYWEEKKLWTRNGGILSDDQKEEWKKITGSKQVPGGSNERSALLLLEKVKG